jgi:hypothetical protein
MSELEYYSHHDFSKYAGKWIALKDHKVLDYDEDVTLLYKRVGNLQVFFISVPDSKEFC